MKRYTLALVVCALASCVLAQSDYFLGVNYGALNGISATNDNGARLNSSVEVYANLDIKNKKNNKLLLGYNYVRENKDFFEETGGSIFAVDLREVHGSANIHVPYIGFSRFREYTSGMQMGFGGKLGVPFYTDQVFVSGGKEVSNEFENIAHWSGIYTEYHVYGQFPTKYKPIAIKAEAVMGYMGYGFSAYSSLGYVGLRFGMVYNLHP